MKYVINRKKRQVVFKIDEKEDPMTFDETWAFIYLLMRKMAASHRA